VPYYSYSPQVDSIYTLRQGAWKAVFNDPFDPNYAGMLTEVSGLDSPDVRESAEDLVEGDGGVHGNFYFGRRPITLNGRIFGHQTARERDIRLDYVRNATLAMRSDAILSWVPRDRITNYVRNPRGLEAYSTNNTWNAYATAGSTATLGMGMPGVQMTSVLGSVGHTTTFFQDNVFSYVDPRGQTVYVTDVSERRDQNVHVRADVTVVSAPANSNARLRVKVRCFDWNGAYLDEPIVDAHTLTTTSGSFTLAGVIPISSLHPNTSRVSIQCSVEGASVTGTIVTKWDQMLLDIRRDTVVPPYVDGNTYSGYWWGDQYSGISGDYLPMEIALRRQQPVRITGPWVKDFQLQMVAANPLITSPITRSQRVNIGEFKNIENMGNAAYFPQVDVHGGLNLQSIINGSGAELKILVNNSPSDGGALFGTIDTLKHTFMSPLNANYGAQINWPEAREWPHIAPGGGMWTLQNGPTGTRTGGYIVVKSRDAWI
jgi:hypothetical protein